MSEEATDFKIHRKRKHRKRRLSEESEDELSEHRRLMANSQERVRMQRINAALENLKHVLPEEYHPCRRRMSKIRTLRSAMEYISGLSEMLERDNERRRVMYMQAREYVACVQQEYHSVYGTDSNLFQTPAPVFPYLGPLCAQFSDTTQQTIEQTPEKQMTVTPRQLNFNAPTKRVPPPEDAITPHVIIARKQDPLRYGMDFRPCDVTPLTNRRPCGASSTSEMFPSPFTGTRNDQELNASILTPSSRASATCTRSRADVFEDGALQIASLCDD